MLRTGPGRSAEGEGLFREASERERGGAAFDTEILMPASAFGFRIVEVPAESVYADDTSSITLGPATLYGVKTVWLSGCLPLHRTGILRRADGWRGSALTEPPRNRSR
jgi:hypothetical protein